MRQQASLGEGGKDKMQKYGNLEYEIWQQATIWQSLR